MFLVRIHTPHFLLATYLIFIFAALAMKGIEYEYRAVNLVNNHQVGAAMRVVCFHAVLLRQGSRCTLLSWRTPMRP